jgi:hypothetical protein
MNDKKSSENPCKYECMNCDYKTQYVRDYRKHLLTAKHQRMTNNDKMSLENPCNFTCICGNNYKFRQGLFNHKKKCNYQKNDKKNDRVDMGSSINNIFIMEIVKENQEFKSLLLEQYKQSELQQKKMMELQSQIIEITQNSLTVPTNTSITNNTTNNQQFNLNIFLNETCKNAISFSDFIDNIQISTDDLENNAKMGFVGGISKLIIDNLQQLSLTDRPIHCTDIKRETIYVKEEEQWEKEKSKEIIEKGIQEITRKNMCHLTEWREENPDYEDMETELGEKSIAMQQNSMSGGKQEEYYPRIIKNVAKDAILDKKKMIE